MWCCTSSGGLGLEPTRKWSFTLEVCLHLLSWKAMMSNDTAAFKPSLSLPPSSSPLWDGSERIELVDSLTSSCDVLSPMGNTIRRCFQIESNESWPFDSLDSIWIFLPNELTRSTRNIVKDPTVTPRWEKPPKTVCSTCRIPYEQSVWNLTVDRLKTLTKSK